MHQFPDLLAMTLEEAQLILEAAGWKVSSVVRIGPSFEGLEQNRVLRVARQRTLAVSEVELVVVYSVV